MCLEQIPVLQKGAVHRGSAAAEQYGERFGGQGDPQMKHGGQDLFGEGEPGRMTAPGVAVEGQSSCEGVQLLPGHAGQGGIGQQGLVPSGAGACRGCRRAPAITSSGRSRPTSVSSGSSGMSSMDSAKSAGKPSDTWPEPVKPMTRIRFTIFRA